MRALRIAALLVVPLPLMAIMSVVTAWAATVRTFESEPVGQPPAGVTAQGGVQVEEVTVGSSRTRAVHVEDRSSTLQTRAIFLSGSQAAKHIEFDLLVRDATQPTIVAVHGNGAPVDTGAWRLLFAREAAGSTTAIASVYNGTGWIPLARVPHLLNPNAWRHITIDASPDTVVLTVGGDRYKSFARAAQPTQITSLEIASAGTAAVGSSAYLDNLLLEPMAATDPRLHGIVPTISPGRIVRGQPRVDVPVAVFTAPGGLTGSQFRADVAGDTPWLVGRVTGPDPSGRFTVFGSVTFDTPGSRPLSVRITTPFGVTTVATAWVAVDALGLVATDPVGAEIRFPDLIRLADGRLLAAYHSAAAHTNANGAIKIVLSSDLGATWTAPRVVWSDAFDNRDPKLVQLADGTILLTFFQTEWVNGQQRNRGVFIMRWAPGAPGFASPVRLSTSQAAYSHGPAVELSNGDVLQPIYGGGARVARSTDGGRTFDPGSEVLVARDTTWLAYQEPNITRLPTGELVMLIRTYDKVNNVQLNATVSRSLDGGRTWTAPSDSGYPASSHHQLLTTSGRVLLTYGLIGVAGRPTWATMISDPSGPWAGYPAIELYDAGTGLDQANPSSAEIAPGRYLTLGFNVSSRTLVARYSTDATYR